MIHTISFKDPDAVDTAVLSDCNSHIPFLRSLRGKTFTFKKGLNIVIGENGSGKTSLLSAIRRLWLTEFDGSVEPVSTNPFTTFFQLTLPRHFNEGLYDLCDMKADYSKPCFCLRKSREMKGEATMNSAFNLSQCFSAQHLSNGMDVLMAVGNLVGMITGSEKTGLRRSDYMDFGKVLKQIEEMGSRYSREQKTFGDRVCVRDCVDAMLEWYRRNTTEKDKCLTAVLDEPDEGLDIYRLGKVRGLLKAVAQIKRDQFICVLHNVALIRSLMDADDVNFIELTDGYLGAIRDFSEGRDVGEGGMPDMKCNEARSGFRARQRSLREDAEKAEKERTEAKEPATEEPKKDDAPQKEEEVERTAEDGDYKPMPFVPFSSTLRKDFDDDDDCDMFGDDDL